MPAGANAAAGLAAALHERLDPGRWPLPLDALPAGCALVGGAVRDALLGRLAARPDLDLVVPSGAIALCRRLARRLGGSAVVLDSERDIGRLVLQGWSFDLAAWEGGSLEADLGRRDYSINALALPLDPRQELLDPTGGLAALARAELVAISEANLLSDPLRLLRGVRLACELGFELEPQTQEWIRQHSPQLAAVASERVLAELEKLACAPGGAAGLQQAAACGLLQPWISAGTTLAAQLTALTTARSEALGLATSERAWALPLARLAALADASALARLHSSRALQKRVQQLRQGLALVNGRDLAQLNEAERFALHHSLEADLPALLLLMPSNPEHRALVIRWRDDSDPLCHPRPPCDGRRLQSLLNLQAGPQLGALLRHLSHERAFGRIAAAASDDQVVAAALPWLADITANRRHV